MGAPAKYNSEIHDKWAWSLAIRGATDQEIADAFEVTERTVNRWKYVYDERGKPRRDQYGEKELSSFGKILQTGKAVADAKVEHSLFDRCIGFTATDEEKILEYSTDGSVKPVKVRSIKKYIPPDVMAIMYWLNNRSRKTGDWTQKQDNAVNRSVEDIQKNIQTIADLINNPEPDRERIEE